ncbi:hypothetical protein ACIQAC_29375 [Streptomyces sp. NPDC088387]|uniref:hypothetical protein n=1 Tax=Streptomyces sp. NPDC088387 TaxID=3365859 RepID=UPI00382CCF23
MLALRLTRGGRPAVQLRRLLVAAAAGGTGFLLLCTLGHAMSHPHAPGGSALRLAWCLVPAAATVQFAVAVARTDPGTRPRPGLSAIGLGPARLMAISATTTALSTVLGSMLALLFFLHLRGDLTGMPFDGAAEDVLAAGLPLPLPAALTLLALVPAAASLATALVLRPREPGGGRTRQGFRAGPGWWRGPAAGAPRQRTATVGRGGHPGPENDGPRAGHARDTDRHGRAVTDGTGAGDRGGRRGRDTDGRHGRTDATAPQGPDAATGDGPRERRRARTVHASRKAPGSRVTAEVTAGTHREPDGVAPTPPEGDMVAAEHGALLPASRTAPTGLPWGISVLAVGLAVEVYATRASKDSPSAMLPGGLAAGPVSVLVGWTLTALGLALAGPGLTHLCGRLLQAVRPGALRMLAGRVLMAEAGRIGRPLGVVCAVASAAYATTALHTANGSAQQLFGPLTTLGSALVAGCTLATLLTAAVEARHARADTTAALLRLGAPATLLRSAAALRAGALLALFVPLTLVVAELAAQPLTG